MRVLDPLHRTRRTGPIRQRWQRPRRIRHQMRLAPTVWRLWGWRIDARDVLLLHRGLQALHFSHQTLVLIAQRIIVAPRHLEVVAGEAQLLVGVLAVLTGTFELFDVVGC